MWLIGLSINNRETIGEETWEPRKTILWRRSMFVVSSSSKLGSREGDWATASTENLDTSQLLDRVCLGRGPDKFIEDLTQKGFALLGILWSRLKIFSSLPDRIGFKRKTWFEVEDDDTRFKLISTVFGFSSSFFLCLEIKDEVTGLFLEVLSCRIKTTSHRLRIGWYFLYL